MSAAEEFGPLFAILDANRRIVDLDDQREIECVNWHLFKETEEGLILRDGVDHWMEESLWIKAQPGSMRTFALRYRQEEYEFCRVLSRRSVHSEPARDRKSNRPQGRRVAA